MVSQAVNAANRSTAGRKFIEKTLGVHRDAPVPAYHTKSARKRLQQYRQVEAPEAEATANTSGKVLLFATCYGNRNMPSLAEDLVAIYRHNGIAIALAGKEYCCGMPKLELGDLDAVSRARDANIPQLAEWVDRGWDIVTPIPSCTLMFKQELPLMFPDDPQVAKVRDAMFDPFEYLMLRHRDGKMRTDFSTSLGKVAYQVPCHLRVQNIGLKTRDVLQLVPDTEVEVIERCSGHDGTYAVKKEFHEISKKIARPVIGKVKKSGARHFVSDCPMAAEQIAQGLDDYDPQHPLGTNAGLLFEDRLTIQYQVQEMLRIERIFEPAGIAAELDGYNPLIPDGSNWKATFMIEFPDLDERRAMLTSLVGIENKVWMQAGDLDKIYAIADEDMQRSDSDKTSAVHFLRFELTAAQVEALRQGAELAAGIDHHAYQVELRSIAGNVRRSLLADLD